MGVQQDNLERLYRERSERFGERVRALGARSGLIGNLRGLAFGVLVVSLGFALWGSERPIASGIAAAGALAFAILIVAHGRVIEAEDEAKRWQIVNQLGQRRVTGRWRNLPDDGRAFADPEHPYADDIDLFGAASLFQRLCVAHTRSGQKRLAALLKAPATAALIADRQAAVRVLAPELELRQKLQALSLALLDRTQAVLDQDDEARASQPSRPSSRAATTPDPEPLLRWAEGAPVLSTQPLLVAAAHVLPLVTLAGIAATAWFGVTNLVWTIPVIGQIALIFQTRSETGRVFNAVSATEGAFSRYGAMLELVESLELGTPLLAALRDRLLAGKQRPSEAMRDFKNKLGWFELKHNGLVHPFANMLLLWDVHCVLALERWQRRAGRVARDWFEVLGEIEALSCLATLAYEEPGFSFPEVADGRSMYIADELGHPLIDPDARVTNDVALPEPGTALLVTGSNMSGKSTLLRAMGLGAVLAFAGAPVPARRMKIARARLCTSIRVRDSLEAGVSHFYAELRKLKGVLDATERGEPVLFLLDEILHGTNSRERQIGARWMLRELLERGAIGAVSTHDMALCRLEDERLMQRVSLVHFRENVKGDQMTFDYKLREGPVLAGNALRLMRLIGLGVPLESSEAEQAAPADDSNAKARPHGLRKL